MKTKFNIRSIFEAIIIILIIADIVLLILITFYDLNPYLTNIIIDFDLAVCVILFFDFIYRMREEENKWAFIKKNWPDIIAMIPFDFFALRLFRLFRLVRILRLFRLVRIFALFRRDLKYILDFFRETHLDFAVGILIFTIFSGTIVFYILESGINPEVHSLWDSFWFTLTTTVAGSSDINPGTFYGRLIAVPMMLIGITFIGMLTASIASYLVKRSGKEESEKEESEIKELKKLVIDMQSEIQKLTNSNKKDK